MPAAPHAVPTATRRVGRLPWAWAWVVEILLVGVGYWLYSLIADAAPRQAAVAQRHADSIRRFESWLHVGVEHAVNEWWTQSHTAVVVGNYYYDGAHFVAPVLALGWLYLRRPELYPRLRTALLIACLVGLAGFWLYPVMPPRLLPHAGFVDTIAQVKTFGSGGSHGITNQENPFAAMPSLHVAWATWSAVCVFALTRRRWARALAVAHPVLTTFVIVATANHYLADAAGGAAAVAFGLAVAALPAGQGGRRAGGQPAAVPL